MPASKNHIGIIREYLGWRSQAKFAVAVGMNRSYLNDIETNGRLPTRRTRLKICALLDAPEWIVWPELMSTNGHRSHDPEADGMT